MNRQQVFVVFFFLAFCFLLYQGYLILSEFLGPLSYAALLAFIFHPLQRRLSSLLRGREGLAAGLMTSAVFLLVMVPTLYLLTLLATQSVSLYESLSAFVASGRLQDLGADLQASRLGQLWSSVALSIGALNIDLPAVVVRASQTVSSFLVAQAPAAAANLFRGAAAFFFTVFALFFLFRDGRRMVAAVRDLIPMEIVDKDAVMGRFADTLSAVVIGSVATAAAQGVLSGLAYWVLGVPFALLLAVITGFLSLIPYGAPVIWVGVVGYLVLAEEYWRAFAMLAWGTVGISAADNIIRPLVIGGRTEISTLLLFFGILGGMQVYGFLGLFLGPAVIAILVAFAQIFRDQYATAAPRRD